MDYTDILYAEEGGIARITINRPEVMNAFRAATCEQLIDAFHRAGWNREIGVIVLSGAGDRAFCTGGDQSAHGNGPAGGDGSSGYDGRGTIGLPVEALHDAIRDVPQPVIARVQGYAIGGGNVLATLCDLTIAGESAKFGQVGPKVGSVDPGFGTAYLGAGRGREAGAGDVVPLPALHRGGGLCHGPGQCRGAGRGPGRGGRALVRGAVEAQPHRAGDRKAVLQRRQRCDPRHRPHGDADPGAVLRHRGGAGEGVQAFREKRPPDFRQPRKGDKPEED